MFIHLLKYKIKTILRAKAEVFWVLAFPIILGTCFYAAFHNITDTEESFNTVPTAIVIENSDDTSIKAVFDSLSSVDDDTTPLLSVTYTDKETANKLLNDGDIKGIITFNNNSPILNIKENGIDETILKEVLDQYIQTQDIISTLSATTQPEKIPELINNVMNTMSTSETHINNVKLTDGNTDNVTDYFYSLIAMACLFSSLIGATCAKQMKANLSSLGLRKNLVPVNRLTIILSDFLASYVIVALSNVLLIIYLEFILKVNLGGNFFLILLVTLIGSLIGLSSGIFVGSLPKLSPGAKEAVIICGSLFLCFLSGLMVVGIKQSIDEFAPFLNKINPATVITDALYSLNIYDTYDKFTECLLILIGFSVLYCGLSYIMTRRETYASV